MHLLSWLVLATVFFAVLAGPTDLSAPAVVLVAAGLATLVVVVAAYLRRRPTRGDVDVTGL
ncbi:hypothetical protein [Arthrobacter sp. Leaf234]|uniref:hypothetical protein n=1 Tax=Arthrobacter sp. Leaf234 TaxID=1736303 RepID=UPI00138F80E2|nr:hypothetical protein [Arthrobacter sp. Leaf234]